MKIIRAIFFVALLASVSLAQNYSIDRYVIASGGGEVSSTNYTANGTIGQAVVGASSSDNYSVSSGYWGGGGGGTGAGCDYVVGDVNNSGGYNGLDITYGVSFFKGGPLPPYTCECTPGNSWYVAGDVNASCSYNGLDITYGVSYFKGGAGPNPCADCPPNGGITITASGQNGSSAVRKINETLTNPGLNGNIEKSRKAVSENK